MPSIFAIALGIETVMDMLTIVMMNNVDAYDHDQDLCYLSGRRALKVLIVLKIGMLPAPEVKNDNRNKMTINV